MAGEGGLATQNPTDGFFFIEKADGGQLMLIDVDSGAEVGLAEQSDLSNLNPNSGVRGLIAAKLVQFQLSDPDPERRLQALTALERSANESQPEHSERSDSKRKRIRPSRPARCGFNCF